MSADPNQIRHLAQLCSAGVDAIIGSTRDLRSAASHAAWQGPAADRFRHELAAEIRSTDRVLRGLAEIHRALDRHADWVEERHRQLRQLERRIRAWAVVHPPVSIAPGPNALLIGPFPPSLDPRWITIAADLRRAGTVF